MTKMARSWRRQACILSVLSALIALPVAGQSESQTGKLKSKVVEALSSVADGTCPARLLSPVLLDQCESQLDRMQKVLKDLGAIRDAQFRGTEQTPTGVEAEVYRVLFANGRMTWMAAAGPNGKLNVLWSPG